MCFHIISMSNSCLKKFTELSTLEYNPTHLYKFSINSKQIMTYSIPYLKFDLFVINSDHTSTKLYSNGEIVHRLEPLVRELEKKARFANSCKKNFLVNYKQE